MTESTYNHIAKDHESTVVAEYIPSERSASHYQTENELEQEFIEQLKENGYEFLNITKNDDLLLNLRKQLSKLNEMKFTEAEWQRLLSEYLIKNSDGIAEKTHKIQEDHIFTLKLDSGSNKNIKILDKNHIHKNSIQIINQYEAEGIQKNRYDVTILINGLPMVHVELKRRGVSIQEAFNQINRYQRESFWTDSGLYEFVQLFVITNGTHTKYYSNTTRHEHVEKQHVKISHKKKSNSFEFSSWWSDANNERIHDLVDFTKTFFAKRVLLSILIKYCIFNVDKVLMVMRPYQIAALERILDRIKVSVNHKKLGSVESGGYIWHTTGSGKTLTSFKTAQLACEKNEIDKVIFVVDRKDLDHQTMQEYNKFKEGSADSNANTKILTEQLSDSGAKIIITTIQKLKNFVGANKNHSVLSKNVVLIFDECHRSQFGKMHSEITKAFKKYLIFGFTGTPIFAENAFSNKNSYLKTTEQVFGDQLHSYTIVDAIKDGNVLPFNIDYNRTMRMKKHIVDEKVHDIDDEAAINSQERIKSIVDYIIEHFNQKTRRNNSSGQQFNSIFAVSSIEAAKKYYSEFQSRKTNLKIATIFSFSPNEAETEVGTLDDENFDMEGLDQSSHQFLENAIEDYNQLFGMNFDTGSRFEGYYKDISKKMKDGDIDLLIVVNMFLTGFDATTLNTLWVDKNLRFHGLLQAFSRTNRILNSVKTYGNIVCFRGLEERTREAIRIFGNKDAGSIVILKTFEEYYHTGWTENGEFHKGYKEMIDELQNKFPLTNSIEGEQNEKKFISLWGTILRRCNILESFDDFEGMKILSDREFQDYQSYYLDLYEKHRKFTVADKEDIIDDIEFEVELIKRIVVNIDYILSLINQFKDTNDENLRDDISRAVNSSIDLRSKKDLIERFIDKFNNEMSGDVGAAWIQFAKENKEKELNEIIKIKELKHDETWKFMNNAFQVGEIRDTGEGFSNILPSMSRFDKKIGYEEKRQSIFDKLKIFFEKYLDL